MCGIVGYINRNSAIDSNTIINNMTRLIQHRGPDDSGTELLSVYSDYNDVALGFTRLSILDTSVKGHQPMFDAERKICITFNGEIYNAFDHKRELINEGVMFRSGTDTEVLLYLYKKYGIEDMLRKINGMFAFCIVDMEKKCTYVARDRLGVKPCYWYKNANTLMWASEIKTFYAHPEFINELNYNAVSEYFLFRYVVGEETLLKNVCNLLPGHYLKISEGLQVNDYKFWDLPDYVEDDAVLNIEELEDLLQTSVTRRLLSDVPLGVQLSGGVDSSLVLSMAKNKNNDIESYSIIFDDARISEKEWMDIAADYTATRQHQYTLKESEFADYFSKMTWHLDAPLNHPNSIGLYLLCKNARKDVKVLLTGEGADEVFGGYPRYSRYIWSQENIELALKEDHERNIKRYWNDPISKAIISSAWYPIINLNRLLPQYEANDAVERRRLFYQNIPGKSSSMQKFLNYELRTYLVDILNRQDKMSMAASIESRVPFLDYKLIEYVRKHPVNQYVIADKNASMEATKMPLKKIAAKYFDNKFAYRSKNGFSLPLQDFFCGTTFSKHCEEYIIPYLVKQNLINIVELNALWKNREYLSSYYIETSLWIVMAFGEFCRVFLQDKSRVVNFT